MNFSCAITPSSDEDFAPLGEEPEGPGVFSGDSGEVILFQQGKPAAADADSGNEPQATESDMTPSTDWEEVAAFKRWLKAKQAKDDDYREFQLWLQFEAFRNQREAAGE